MRDHSAQTRLIPLTKWPDYHPWPPVGGLRHLVFHAESNGFNAVVRRAGRRVLIDEAAFFNWLSSQGRSDPGVRGVGRDNGRRERP